MSSLNAIYVDDELPALELIKNYCKEIPEINLLGCFTRAEQALEFIKTNPVDLLILDIEMPEMSGIELAKIVPADKLVMFITADPTHAAQAFELDVIDYLVKPVFPERLVKAIRKAQDFFNFQESNHTKDYIIFKADYMINKVRITDIQWIEGFGEYLKIMTRFKQYMVLQRLSDFIEKNIKLGFIRIHKSYIVQREHIQSYNSQFVVLKNGKQLPIGRTYKDNLK